MIKKLKGATKSKFMYLATTLAILEPVLENFPEVEKLLADNYGWNGYRNRSIQCIYSKKSRERERCLLLKFITFKPNLPKNRF